MSIRHDCIPLTSPDEWARALDGIRHGPGHTWGHCLALSRSGDAPPRPAASDIFLYRFTRRSIRIVCPILERRFENAVDICTPYGFSGFVGNGDCREFQHFWREFVAARGYTCGYIGLHPLFENRTYFDSAEVHEYNRLYFLDLTLSEAELFANLSQNRRRDLRNLNSSSGLWDSDAAAKEFFLAHYAAHCDRKNVADAYRFSPETLAALLQQKNVFACGAPSQGHPDGNLEAAAIFSHTAAVADYLFGIALPGCEHHASRLVWEGVRRLKALGIPVLNLGGGVREDDGVAEFKRRFGAWTLPLRSLKQVYDDGAYDRFCRSKAVSPSDRAGYFPAFRQSTGEEVPHVR